MSAQIFSEREWQALHEEVQKRFHLLVDEMQAAAPYIQPKYGMTVTKRFPLFSHVSFPLQSAGATSDIIVGVDIGPEDAQWRIDADICEETEGTVYFELPRTPFSVSSFAELYERVLATTDELVARGKPVLLRLFGSPPPVVPSQCAGVPEVARKS